MKTLITLFFGFISLSVSAVSEAEGYLKAFEHSAISLRKDKAELIVYSGITDDRVFGKIEALLLQDFNQNSGSGAWVDYVAWMTKALASSGKEKYRATIEKVISEAKNGKVKKYGRIALKMLDQHKQWKPLLNKDTDIHFDDPMHKYYYNMLRSDDFELMAIGGKRVFWEKIYKREIVDALNEAILKNYNKVPNDGELIDGFAWMIRALGNAGAGADKYKNTLNEVADKANNRKIKKYAIKYSSY